MKKKWLLIKNMLYDCAAKFTAWVVETYGDSKTLKRFGDALEKISLVLIGSGVFEYLGIKVNVLTREEARSAIVLGILLELFALAIIKAGDSDNGGKEK